MNANNQAAGAMSALGMTPPENDLRDAVARAESNGRLLPQQIENGCTWENESPIWQSLMRQEADRLLASSGGKVLVARLHAAETDLAKARADLERATAERDEAREERDALLRAAGFKPGPFRDALSRQVLLEDVAGRRPAMVEARRAAGRNQNDADLWTMRMLDEWPGDTLLIRLWRQRREATKRADTAEAETTRLGALLDEARATNRRLHRRLQAVEGPTMARAAKAERAAAFWFKRRKAAGERNSALRAENTRLRALLVDAGEALRPFCFGDPTLEHILFGEMPDDAACTLTVKLHDTRRARSTLAALDKAPTPKEPA